jgi:hypothetical protein
MGIMALIKFGAAVLLKYHAWACIELDYNGYKTLTFCFLFFCLFPCSSSGVNKARAVIRKFTFISDIRGAVFVKCGFGSRTMFLIVECSIDRELIQ